MCGIAGIVDLSGRRRTPPRGAVQAMARAIVHRGPDEDGFLELPGLAFANRRLSIVGLFDGKQPIRNEDGSVAAVFNGEFFDYPEKKAELEARGHTFATHCDTELIPHLWEDHGEDLFPHLLGQFAFAVWDERRRTVVLARDRFGICPLFWTRVSRADGDWLLFASEVKALLASGMVEARPDPKGLNHVFTFFALPGPVTCFEGVRSLSPGHYLRIQMGDGGPARVEERTYWAIDFPDQGQEDRGSGVERLTDEFDRLLQEATARRLRADVPVVSYLSGGIDSSVVVAMASKARGTPIPCFTIRIKDPKLDETAEAAVVARHVGADPVVVDCGAEEVVGTYPELIRAAEGPVIDTSCAALLLLARKVHAMGFKVALTGEGSDEWLGGYAWHKVNRVLGWLNVVPGVNLALLARRLLARAAGTQPFTADHLARAADAVGGYNGWHDIYALMSLSKERFYSPWMKEATRDHVPYEDLGFDAARVRRWHPFNRELALSGRCHLAGHLLQAKGDRVAMNSSVETRYPFLDERVFDFLARVPPEWKLRGLKDKELLRRVGERWLPLSIARRKKGMFRAPFNSFHLAAAPAYVDQLLSEESLKRTGYFEPAAVARWRSGQQAGTLRPWQRVSVEMGLVGVVATQLWHHTYVAGGLCELPSSAGDGRAQTMRGGHAVLSGNVMA